VSTVFEEIIPPPAEVPKKLENFLKKRFPVGYIRKLFRKNGIRLNGRHPSRDDLVRPGDRIHLYIPFKKHSKAPVARELAHVKLDVIFQDREFLVINKPAGVAVHEGKTILRGNSVFGMLHAKYRGEGITPWLVHRLDKDTSGLLLVAKNERLAEELEALFKQGKVVKEYLCLLVGRLSQANGTIDFPLPGRDGNSVRALTCFEVIDRYSETTLIRARMDTGRMHQIRLHFAKLGYPVVMDDRHGDFAFNKRFKKAYGLKRQFLHAAKLTLDHRSKKRNWQSPLPADLAETLSSLEQSSRSSIVNRSQPGY
jgi:23S rRNA pseudouridine955/2504/2580 synthase